MPEKKIEVSPMFWRACSDAMYALNVCVMTTSERANLIKLVGELDAEFKSISQKVKDNGSEKDR